jgi:TonB family protein
MRKPLALAAVILISTPALADNPKAQSPKQEAQAGSITWTKDFCNRLAHAWTPPKGERYRRIVLQIEIDTRGNTNPKIITSSGSKAADKAALDAIKKISPVKPWITEGKPSPQTIELTFAGKRRTNDMQFIIDTNISYSTQKAKSEKRSP